MSAIMILQILQVGLVTPQVFWGVVCLCFLARPLGILVPLPEKEPALPAVERRSPNHWTTREFWQHGVDALYISVFKKTRFNLQHNRSH